MADIVSVDSYAQCMDHGKIAVAFTKGLVNHVGLIELGEIIDNGVKDRTDNQQITLTDLTGVAVQDIKTAPSVYKSYMNQSK